jgi:hypothetical protein
MPQIVYGVSGALSLAAALYLLYSYTRRKELADVFAAAGFAVYFVLALLMEEQIPLGSPLAAPLGDLLPLLISLGVFKLVLPKFWKYYAVFAAVGMAAIAAVRAAVAVVHGVAGLVIILFPIYAVARRRMTPHFLGITLGGLAMGINGAALASAEVAHPILPLGLAAALLPWTLLLMVIFFAYGFTLGRKK